MIARTTSLPKCKDLSAMSSTGLEHNSWECRGVKFYKHTEDLLNEQCHHAYIYQQ